MKHMEEMKIAGLAMALCIVMLGIYIVVHQRWKHFSSYGNSG